MKTFTKNLLFMLVLITTLLIILLVITYILELYIGSIEEFVEGWSRVGENWYVFIVLVVTGAGLLSMGLGEE